MVLPRRASLMTLFLLLHRRAASFSARRVKLEGARSARGSAPARPKAKQSLGQNFLVDVALARRVADSVVAEGEEGSRVIELGPGQGAITGHLHARFPRMHAVELDERMIGVLSETLPTLDVVHGDMLRLELGALAEQRGGQLSLVSNTPFYLTSPLLFKLCAGTEHVSSAVLTMQKEVGEKVLSRHGCKEYGILSVMLQLFGRPTHLFDLPPEAFAPAPKVTSSVLHFSPSAAPPGEAAALSPSQRAALLGLLKLTFETRRKMLRVSLKKLLATGAVSPPPERFLTLRPEQLSPSEWLELARALFGDDLGGPSANARGVPAADAAPLPLLERHHVNKAWRAHKAGYKHAAERDGTPPLREEEEETVRR